MSLAQKLQELIHFADEKMKHSGDPIYNLENQLKNIGNNFSKTNNIWFLGKNKINNDFNIISDITTILPLHFFFWGGLISQPSSKSTCAEGSGELETSANQLFLKHFQIVLSPNILTRDSGDYMVLFYAKKSFILLQIFGRWSP